MAVRCSRFASKWHDVEPPPRCLIHIPQHRLVISHNRQLEAWLKSEEVLPHEAGCDRVAAGHLLDPGLRPSTPLLRLTGSHETSPAQHSQIRWVLVALR